MSSPKEVLAFWFQDSREAGIKPEHSTFWFARDKVLDQKIRSLFFLDWQAASAGQLDAWKADAEGCLAMVILLDQFSRNLFRNDARAFSQDSKALAMSLAMINHKEDLSLSLIERVFAYLPLEHAEDRSLQALSVRQYEALLSAAPSADKSIYQNFLDYAVQHKTIIDQFGRFPHRNQVLERVSSADELAFLQQPNSSF